MATTGKPKKAPVIEMNKGEDKLRFEPFKLRSGETVASLRAFYLDKKTEEWKPAKQGLTLRKAEIRNFVKCMKELYDQMPDEED